MQSVDAGQRHESPEQPNSAPAPTTPVQQPLQKPASVPEPQSEPVLDFTSAGSSLGLDPDAGFQVAGGSRSHRTPRGHKSAAGKSAVASSTPPVFPPFPSDSPFKPIQICDTGI